MLRRGHLKKLEKIANEIEPGSFSDGKFKCKHHGSRFDGCVYLDRILQDDSAVKRSKDAVDSVAASGKGIHHWVQGECLNHPYQVAEYIVSNVNESGVFSPHHADWKAFFGAYIKANSGKNESPRQQYLLNKPKDSIKVVREFLFTNELPPTEAKILEIGEQMVAEYFNEPFDKDPHYLKIKRAFDTGLKNNLATVLRTVEKEFGAYGDKLVPKLDLGKIWHAKLKEHFGRKPTPDSDVDSDKVQYGLFADD